MSPTPPAPKLSRLQKRGLYAAVALAVYAILGFFVAPPIVRDQTVEALADTLGREVRLAEVKFNPFTLALTGRKFEVLDGDGSPFVEFEELQLDLQASSIFRRALALREVRLVGPFVHLKVGRDGVLNFADILERLAEGDEEEAPSDPLTVLIFLAAVEEGRVLFSDFSRPTPFEYEISPLNVELRDFGTRPEDQSPYSFSATTGAGETVEWEGNLSVVPLYSSGKFALTGVRPRTGWLYFQDDVSFEVVDGTVDIKGGYDLDAREALDLKLQDGSIRVRDFAVAERESGQRAVEIKAFDIEGIALRYPEQAVEIAKVSSSGGRYHMQRLEDGRFRVERLLESQGAATPTGSGEGIVAVDDGGSAPSASPTATATSTPPPTESAAEPWHVAIEAIAIEQYRLEFDDLSTREPVRLELDPITLTVGRFTNEPGETAEVTLDVVLQKTGRFGVKGRVGVEPPLVELDLDVADIDLRSFEPYWAESAAVGLDSGSFALTGSAFARGLSGDAPETGFDGGFAVRDVRALDGVKGQDLISWSALELEGLSLRSEPMSLALASLTLRDPAAQILIGKDGVANLQRVAVAPEEGGDSQDEPAPDTQAPPAQVAIRIDSVEVVNASTRIVDRSVVPSFSSGVTKLSGKIEGLSSDPEARPKFDLRGQLDGATPIQVTGIVSPLAARTYADVRLKFENFELSPFTPYSGRYIGKAIGRGKLVVDLNYQLDGNSLVGENKIFLDQFTLGESIDSPDAVDLPVGLAIGLLKDRKGEIHIDLPVRGETDDPEFGVGRLIAAALRNLITKVALSPFSMMGGLVGVDGDEMRFIEFEAGSAALAATEQGKLDALTTALVDRPGLSLELSGTASPTLDRPALQAAALDAQIRRARFEELQAKWFEAKPERVEDVVLSDEETSRLLVDAYKKQFDRAPELSVPPPAPGVTPAPGSEAAARIELLRESLTSEQTIDAAAMRELARQRAQTIRDALVADGRLGPERVFFLEPTVQDEEGATQARCAMSLVAN